MEGYRVREGRGGNTSYIMVLNDYINNYKMITETLGGQFPKRSLSLIIVLNQSIHSILIILIN